MGRGHRGGTVAAIALVVALAGAACSGGDDRGAGGDGAADRSTTVATTTTAAPPARYAGHRSPVYSDPANWICRPDADDVCDSGLDATVVAADGTLTEEP
jgi:hypothetical protein